MLLQGRAERLHEGDAALADISALARAYEEPAKAERSIRDFATQERISFLLRPDAILVHR